MLVYKNIADIVPVATSHGVGSKMVLANGADELVKLKQIAYAKLLPGQAVEPHIHTDMDEIYYFQAGQGSMYVDNTEYSLQPGTFIYVPSGAEHKLICNNSTLEFFYFGLEKPGNA